MTRRPLVAFSELVIALVVGCACVATQGTDIAVRHIASPGLGPVDVLVFAPHPDDEVIGTGGVIQQAAAKGERVRIVFVTNGDGYPRAASVLTGKPISGLSSADYIELAATRQREAIAAAALLGVGLAGLVFLGYPDGALEHVYSMASNAPARSPWTARSATYGPRVIDYHTRTHGRPAPYTQAGALADVEEVLRQSEPGRIYVTDQADQHPDHRATFKLVRDAIAGTGSRAQLLTYDVHGGQFWPWPLGPTPLNPLESDVVDGARYPIGLQWPPPIRVPLTEPESTIKLRALMAHRSQWSVDRAYLESFVKSEEVFWTVAPR